MASDVAREVANVRALTDPAQGWRCTKAPQKLFVSRMKTGPS